MPEVTTHEAPRLPFVDALRALAATLFAYVATLAAAEALYRAVVVPAISLSRRFA